MPRSTASGAGGGRPQACSALAEKVAASGGGTAAAILRFTCLAACWSSVSPVRSSSARDNTIASVLRPDFGPLAPQAAVMAAITAVAQLTVCGGLALAAGKARETIVGNGRATIWIGCGAGVLLVTVSLVTLLEGLRQ